MSDDLIARAQTGDQTAFRQIVQAYHPLMWRVARAILADRTVAEDVIQEAWLDVWRGLPRFDPARPFRPWLLTIVANRCRMTNRRRVPLTVALDVAPLDLASGQDIAEQMIRSETDAALTAALAALPPEQRQLIELRYFARLDISEIALVTALPVGTVKSRISRTLVRMRAHLKHLNEPAECKERHA